MNALQNPLALLGRILIAWFFIIPGLGKLTGFAGAVGYAQSAGMPMPEVGVAVGLAIEILGGLALLLGLGTRYAAAILAIFTLAATMIFHAYWSVPAEAVMVTKLLFNKNIGIVGGLLAFAAFGAGAWSLDAKRRAS
ncbi:DoxX family protein [Comamonas piscis]|uniref:DoxX family protein n=1 Tax=Comamonas piscis TaxID=1562974 RepID=A0A7G5EIU8_9BURK|nr:DoxX family protein [Comamonas piscis]QMV73923.1 DoxX family protein [Comamonas piscis]WSO32348.1 DoxX family protein [Comamonas piscis]